MPNACPAPDMTLSTAARALGHPHCGAVAGFQQEDCHRITDSTWGLGRTPGDRVLSKERLFQLVKNSVSSHKLANSISFQLIGIKK